MNLYHQELLDHYRHPRHRGSLEAPDFCSEQHNPSCGDSILWQGCVDGLSVITHIAFEGKGCVVSQAAASMLAVHCLGKSLLVIIGYDNNTMLGMIGMELGPTRLKCALLPLEALQAGVVAYTTKSIVEG